ncbi:MAG: hypothetical protein JWO78_969 [Micavibrio sp.]|nr:hypothetical protein [Micavibrio sp.]
MVRLEIETYHDAGIMSEAVKSLAQAYQCLQDMQHPEKQAWSSNATPDTLAFLKQFYTDIASSPSAAYRHTVLSSVEDIVRAYEPDYSKLKNIYRSEIKNGPNIVIHCAPALASRILNEASRFPGVQRAFQTNTGGPSLHP